MILRLSPIVNFSVANQTLRWCKDVHNTAIPTASHHLLHIPKTLSTVISAGGGETNNTDKGKDEERERAEIRNGKEDGSSVSLHMSIALIKKTKQQKQSDS